MKTITFIIDIENDNVRTQGSTSVKGNVDGNINFYEAGIYGLTDREEIEEVLLEMHEDEYDEVIVEFVGTDFSKSVKASADIKDLEKLGWNMDVEDGDEEIYHVDITVNDEGKTTWCLTNTEKANNGIWEGSDREETGDDEQTIKDLQKLYKEGKLFDVKTEYYGA